MKVVATTRQTQGTSASRRLRHTGKVPGILYGNGNAVMLEIEHNPLWHAMKKEAFHSTILEMELDGKGEKVLLRDFHMHAYKQQILHIDFQRVDAKQKIHVKVPLHYSGEEGSPAVKGSGGLVNHVVTELDISCLPGALPEFIAVDLSNLTAGHPLHLNDIKLPEGVTPVYHSGDHNPVLVTVTIKGGAEEEPAPAAAAAAPVAAPAPEKK
ncbi:MAG: 50S ribosomal protein L25/general stress protein Ctc [Burkholderiaceae bacterium]|nr:MAG: 50S ribosomal protein L25/general stress protein Ctc [Burkholderiaceae bacterium]